MYKQFKEAAGDLAVRADDQKYVYYRQFFDGEQQHITYNDSLKNATLFDLLRALKRAIDKAPKPEKQHIVSRQPITIEEKVEHIFKLLTKRNKVSFAELIGQLPKMHIVVTFLALLDLVKSRRIWLVQDTTDDDIVISQRAEPMAADIIH